MPRPHTLAVDLHLNQQPVMHGQPNQHPSHHTRGQEGTAHRRLEVNLKVLALVRLVDGRIVVAHLEQMGAAMTGPFSRSREAVGQQSQLQGDKIHPLAEILHKRVDRGMRQLCCHQPMMVGVQ